SPLPVRMIKGAWMGCAHLVGGSARRLGQGAQELDPAHRRDGVALLLLALTIITAGREWFQLDGFVMEYVHVLVAGAFGIVGVAFPLLLLWLSVRFMRNPRESAVTSRKSIGLSAIVVCLCGLVAIGAGRPRPGEA